MCAAILAVLALWLLLRSPVATLLLLLIIVGSSDRANLTAACYSCNSLKSDQPLLAFLLRLHDPQRRRRR
jgi:5-methylcytosine-specific restriction endonuclease McrA